MTGEKKKGDKYFSIYIVYTELNETQEHIFLANEDQSHLDDLPQCRIKRQRGTTIYIADSTGMSNIPLKSANN